jgi:uncharacterized iron-regulated membrane protein
VFGLLPALLLVTGAWLWWRRHASAASRKRTPRESMHGGPAAT